jgi:hypothetical protein
MAATAFRLERQHLSARAPAGSAVDVVRRLCGVHAQVLSSADLILWTRVRGYRPETLETALWQERSLVKTWLLRGTLHLVPDDDLPLYVAALDNRGEYQGAWLRAYGVTADETERLIEAVGEALGEQGLTREELIDAVAPQLGTALAARLRSGWGEFLKPVARRGLLCFGPTRGQNVTFVRPDRWLRRWRTPPGRGKARAELLHRFLAAYGPASPDDFERWLGVNRRLKEPWEALATEVEEVAPKLFALTRDRGQLDAARAPRGVRLLPAFDPYVLHPVSARPVDEEARARVYRQAGWVSPVVLERGRAVGVWQAKRRGRAVSVSVQAFAPLAPATQAAVAREAASLARHLGGELELS